MQGYGFVEFSLPSAAVACKRAMDEIERNMRPDPKKLAPKSAPKKLENLDEVVLTCPSPFALPPFIPSTGDHQSRSVSVEDKMPQIGLCMQCKVMPGFKEV